MDRIELYKSKKDCCGCGVCINICPTQAINWKKDKEGFLYPTIHKDLCIYCKKCLSVCPLKHYEFHEDSQQFYWARSNNDQDRKISSSGGIFPIIATYVLNHNGYVFAAGFNEKMEVTHQQIDTIEKLPLLQGSKYVQSNLKDTYLRIQKLLQKKRRVLFVGTPCQVQGLRNFLNRDYSELILIDIVCYGVPSPGFWKDYLHYLNNRLDSPIDKYCFRDKRNNNNGHTVSWSNGKIERVIPMEKDIYSNIYFQNLIIRPSCHSCPFCKTGRNSDLTLGDFWGIEKLNPSLDDKKGNSLVIVQSHKAKYIGERISAFCKTLECTKNDIEQPRLMYPTPYPSKRKIFMSLYKTMPFSLLIWIFKHKNSI